MHKKIVALTLLATMLIGSPGLVFAFGLGEIQINSALNQPMDAEIELVGFNAATIDEVQVELASQQMFERVGVPRPYILTRLKFTPMILKGKPIIRVTSTDSIREPFLTFLVDVRWAKGKLLREYTVLLDPPVFGEKARATIQAPKVSTQPAPVANKPVSKPRTVATTPAPKVPTPSVRPKQAAVPSTVSKPVPLKKTKSSTRPVRRGDTLWSIAEPYARENGVSVNQMMLAIQEANPQGFTRNNINNLKSGVVLRIPAEDLSKYSARDALAEVRRQWQVWKQVTQTDSAVNVDAGEMVEAEAMETPESSEQQTKDSSSSLSILGDGDATDGKTGDDANATLKELRRQVNLLKESTQSKGQENAELKGRIESLESMIKKQEDIISLQNEQLAQLQNTLAADNGDSIVEQVSSDEEAMNAATEALALAEEQVADIAAEMEVEPEQAIKAATVEPLPDFSGPIPEEFLAAEQQAEVEQPESLVAEAEITPEIVPEVAAVETAAEVSFVEKITSIFKDQSKSLLYAGGALIALLLGWLGLKRRNANVEDTELVANGLPAFEDEPSVDQMLDETVIATPDSIDEALDDLETVNAEDEVEEESVFAGDDTTADSDDVLAEADVYISYGLYQQAEELLKDGLAKEPGNAKYQVKLAEIYSGDKKPDAFVQHVEAMESSIDKQSPEWAKIVSMGAALVPAHALFAGAESTSSDSSEVVVNDEVATEAMEANDINDFSMDSDDMEDFESDDLDDNSLDFSFGDDGELSDEIDQDSAEEATQTFANDLEEDELEESSTAILEASLDFDSEVESSTENDSSSDEETLAFDLDETSTDQASADDSSDSNDVFLDFDEDSLENELNSSVSHDGETEMLDSSLAASADLDNAINLDDDLNDKSESSGIKVDNDLDEMLDGDNPETEMFDSSLFDADSPEAKAFAGDSERVDEDTVSLEQVQENLTAELETLSFDSDDIDPDKIEEDSLPTLQTSELGKPDLDLDDLSEDLAASETGTFEKDMLTEDVTEQFDVGNIDSTMTDLGEFGDDYELENPSVIEEVGTKLDLAKAFVDMGDEDAAKETLTEVMEQGDQTQIQQAKDLLDKLS
ncbi:MAG: FimV/HubP family polar landmark protein [Gammaproteobacteria bacterium]|nr:FimV/HubP family polar landmark protein [Gammaproteobacteria bacterium]